MTSIKKHHSSHSQQNHHHHPAPGDAHLRDQVDSAFRETKYLKLRVEVLERENQALKKSVYDLSIKLNLALSMAPTRSTQKRAFYSISCPIDTVDTLDSHDQEDTYVNANETSSRRNSTITKQVLRVKHEIKVHQGAVYSVKYSQCGNYLASGSFDKTVRVFGTSQSDKAPKELHTFKEHSLNVSEVAWNKDCQLLSGSFDQTCKLWDISVGTVINSFDCEGFVQCVSFDSNDANIHYYGTSRKVLGMADSRVSEHCRLMRNDAMINTIQPLNDNQVISGDSNGYLKVWDTRTGACVYSLLNTIKSSAASVSHIASLQSAKGLRIAVNCFDNILRIYDVDISSDSRLSSILEVPKGHRNNNWPIRSSFFRGPSSALPTDMQDQTVLASGSVDSSVYLYQLNADTGKSQKIFNHHQDRVYSVDFHPRDFVLASAGYDSLICIWG